MTARDRLDAALVHLAAQGQRPPCGQPWAGGLWTSDDKADREHAARLCRSCPALDPCRDAADEGDERHHVWGGIDRTRAPGKKRADPRSAPQKQPSRNRSRGTPERKITDA